MWKTFIFGGYKVVAKVYDEGSKFGIEGFSRISKMEIRLNGKLLYNYDRGLDINLLPDGFVKWICELITLT